MTLNAPHSTDRPGRNNAPRTRELGVEGSVESDSKRILAEFGGISVPRAGSPILVLMVGLPGSGKSTIARRLAQATGALTLESDAIRIVLCSPVTHADKEDRRVWLAIHEAARRLIRERKSVIIDGTNVTEANRRPVYRLAESANCSLLIVEVTATQRVVAARLDERELLERSRGENTDWFDVYSRMAGRVEPISREHFMIDTSDSVSSEAALDRVLEACREAEQS